MPKCWGQWGFRCMILHMNWPHSVCNHCSPIHVRSSLLWSKVWHVLILSLTLANPPADAHHEQLGSNPLAGHQPLARLQGFLQFYDCGKHWQTQALNSPGNCAAGLVGVWCTIFIACVIATWIVVWPGFLLCTRSCLRWIFIITKICPSPPNYPILLLITVINISKHESFSRTLSSCGQVAIVSCMVHPTTWSHHKITFLWIWMHLFLKFLWTLVDAMLNLHRISQNVLSLSFHSFLNLTFNFKGS